MCLDSKWTKKEIKEITDEIGKDGITVYKVVGVTKKGYYPPASHTSTRYKNGLNEAIQSKVELSRQPENHYQAGFHFYQTEKDAKMFLGHLEDLVINSYYEVSREVDGCHEVFRKKYKVIECTVKKSWITMMGRQASSRLTMAVVIVAKKAIFPESP